MSYLRPTHGVLRTHVCPALMSALVPRVDSGPNAGCSGRRVSEARSRGRGGNVLVASPGQVQGWEGSGPVGDGLETLT